jgi:hypothetical protein
VSRRNLFGDLKILTVTSLYIFEILCYIKENQIYMTQYLDFHNYNIRGKQGLYAQLCSTTCCKKSVINMGIKLHNNLPTEIKRIENFKDFKDKFKFFYYKTAFILYKSCLVVRHSNIHKVFLECDFLH